MTSLTLVPSTSASPISSVLVRDVSEVGGAAGGLWLAGPVFVAVGGVVLLVEAVSVGGGGQERAGIAEFLHLVCEVYPVREGARDLHDRRRHLCESFRGRALGAEGSRLRQSTLRRRQSSFGVSRSLSFFAVSTDRAPCSVMGKVADQASVGAEQ